MEEDERTKELIKKEARMSSETVKKYGDKDIFDLGKETCEHELNLIDENWMSESVFVTAECQKCKVKFSGLLVEK